MAADLFETYAVTAVAVMLLGVLTFQRGHGGRALPARARRRGDHRLDHRHVRRASPTGNVERALYQGLIAVGPHRRGRLLPGHQVADGRHLRRRATRASASSTCARSSASSSPRCLFVITDYYTSTRFGPVKKTAAASQTGHATNIIPGLARACRPRRCPRSSSCSASSSPGSSRRRHRHLRHRRRGHGPALADRPDRRARRVRPDHRQRRRHRRDGRPARGGPQRHRPARRGRQHDQGRHQGLRDRLGRARGDRAVRRLQGRARRRGRRTSCSRSTTRRSSWACCSAA